MTGSAVISVAHFAGNLAQTGDGGGLSVSRGGLSLVHTRLISNTAAEANGGGLAATGTLAIESGVVGLTGHFEELIDY